MDILSERVSDLINLLPKFESACRKSIENLASEIVKVFESGNKVLIFGNGGSAADAQHLAAEFVNSFSKQISRPALPAIALTTDSSVLTAIGNDRNFEEIFSRQIEGIGSPGDLVIAISTSGNSKNCLMAIETALKMKIKTAALTSTESNLGNLVDFAIQIPALDTQQIQACHLLTYHVLVELIECKMYL